MRDKCDNPPPEERRLNGNARAVMAQKRYVNEAVEDESEALQEVNKSESNLAFAKKIVERCVSDLNEAQYTLRKRTAHREEMERRLPLFEKMLDDEIKNRRGAKP